MKKLLYYIGRRMLLEYYITDIEKQKDFTIQELVNDITFINQSQNANIYVNNTLLVPGQAFDAGGNFGECNYQLYNVSFVYTGIGTQVNSCVVLLKQYKHIDNV
jgi:hypothetical protein